MRNNTTQVRMSAFALLLFIITGFNSIAQEAPKADNTVHDKLYSLIQASSKVSLPTEVIQHINSMNAGQTNNAKNIYSQTTVFKVLHNKALSKGDRKFFGNHYLKDDSPAIVAIYPDIKKLLADL